MITLHARTSHSISLEDTLNAVKTQFEKDTTVGLFYTPRWCRFGQVHPDGSVTSPGGVMQLDEVFEARVFNEKVELRWLNEVDEPDGLGTAVLLSEEDIGKYLKSNVEQLEAIATHPQTYLLWGEGTTTVPRNGWSRLSTARIGKLDIPLADVTQGRVLLHSLEYWGEVDKYGNVAVVEERLTGLKVRQ